MADKKYTPDQRRIDEHNRAAVQGLAMMYPQFKNGNATKTPARKPAAKPSKKK